MASASWWGDENQCVDDRADADSDRHNFGESSIPKMKPNRKRNYACSGLVVDDFADDFERRLKLTPESAERLEVADTLFKNSQFMMILMKSLPETCVRKLAMTCSEFRSAAYKALRERHGNSAFVLLWLSDKKKDSSTSPSNTFGFDPKIFFHPVHLKEPTVQNGPLANREANLLNKSLSDLSKGGPLTEINFILTYGTANMEEHLLELEEDENKTLKSATLDVSTLLVLSQSIVLSTPDGQRVLHSEEPLSLERKMIASILFPSSRHIVLESFLVPASMSQEVPCISSVIGSSGVNKHPKALIFYQYLSLVDSEPGLVEVLNSLQLTHGCSAFPMVTGIYNYLDGSLPNHTNVRDPVASGLLICGDDFCNVSVITLNLGGEADRRLYVHINKIAEFYIANNYTTKCALVFYHKDISEESNAANIDFKTFINCFHRKLPDVKLLGIDSLTGAHTMVATPNANETFNKLNIKMTELAGTNAKNSAATMDIVLVLISFQTD